jgi:hypothetical protein
VSIKSSKYLPLEDACEECGIRRGVVLSRYFNKLLCWKCYDELSASVNYKNRPSSKRVKKVTSSKRVKKVIK